MTQIPEGATHHKAGHYYRKIGPTWMLFGSDHTWIETACHWEWLEDNAQPLAPAWTGEGLPPVGTVCERMWSSGPATYVKIRVLAHDEGQAVYRFLEGGRSFDVQADAQGSGDSLNNQIFRPARTPAQLAAEEREKAIEFMMQMTSSLGHSDVSKKILFGELYDKGLRFEVKP